MSKSMHSIMRQLMVASFAAISIGLTGCGGGSTDSPAASNTNNPSANTISLTGVVVDGYLKGATAFVDRNNNGTLDIGEPSGITTADGRYTLTGLKVGDEMFPIVVSIPKDAIDSDTDLPVGNASIMTTPAPGTLTGDVVISPITTLIKTHLDSTPGADIKSAEDAVRVKLGVTNAQLDLHADYVAAKDKGDGDSADYAHVHKIAQVVARAVSSQMAKVTAAAETADKNVTLADVIAMITNNVITQLATIKDEVKKVSAADWDAKSSGDAIVNTATLPVDTYAASFAASVQNQMNSTLAATKKAEANALQAVSQAEILKQETQIIAAQAAVNNASAQQANVDAQAALAAIQGLLAQAQADKYTQAQAALDAQALQDSYAQAVAEDTYSMVQAQAAQVQIAIAADPYAYSATQQAAVTQAVTFANTQQIDAYAAAQQAVLDAQVQQAALDAAAAQAKADQLAAQQAAIDAASAQAAAATNTVKLSVRVDIGNNKSNGGSGSATAPPILAAVVVVDGIEYPVDANGDIFVAGLDVGLHDVHVFADGYTWISIYQYTANTAGNTFHLSQGKGDQYNGNNGQLNYISLTVMLPAGTVIPQYGAIELTFTDTYGNTGTSQVSSNGAQVNFPMDANITPNANLTGVITATSTTCDMYGYSCTQTSFADIPNVTVATSPTWNTAVATTINLSKPAVQTPVAVSSQSMEVRLDVNLLNSALSAGQVVNNANSSTRIDGRFTWTDANGQSQQEWLSVANNTSQTLDAYTNTWASTVNPGPAAATIHFWDMPAAVGGTVTGYLSFSEVVYDYTTGTQTTTNVVDMGMQTFTVSAAPYVHTGNALPATSTVDVSFPLVPPTSATVLTIQSVIPPAGMIVDAISVRDDYAYSDHVWAGQAATGMTNIVLPHTFSSMASPKGSLEVSASATSFNFGGNMGWRMSQNNQAIGSVVNLTSAFTTMPSIDPYNTGSGVITYDFGGANTLANVGYISLNDYTTGMMWNIFTPPSSSSVILPAVPVAITSPWVKGTQYDLEYEMDILGSFTYNSFFNVYFSDQGGLQMLMQMSNNEFLYDYTGIPYTY